MASDKYISSQEILKRCFQNNTGKLKATGGTYTTQDYFNAVYDNEKDSLRISIDGLNVEDMISGGYWGDPVVSEELLPENAKINTLTPVISTSGVISFYYKTEEGWRNLPTLPLKKSNFLDWGSENQDDLMYLVENKKKLEDILNDAFEIKEEVIVLKSNAVTPIVLDINGEEQDINDLGNADGDVTTLYRIAINGYVLSTETYADNNAPVSDKCYFKTVFNKNDGEYGVTYIYMDEEEYTFFSSLNAPKNILKVFYLQNKDPENKNDIKETTVSLRNVDATKVKIDVQGKIQDVEDIEDSDGDPTTHYCIKIGGYVLSVENYAGNEAPLAEKYFTKMVYNRNEGEYGTTYLYFEKDEYEYFASLNEPKNSFEIYYLQTKPVNVYQSNISQQSNVTNILSSDLMPSPNANYLNKVILCTKDCVVNEVEYKKGIFYICNLVDSNYVWSNVLN